MLDRGELVQRHRTDPLSRRVWCQQVRKTILELLELTEEGVVRLVGDLWRVLDVVELIVVANLGPELADSLLSTNVRRRHCALYR